MNFSFFSWCFSYSVKTAKTVGGTVAKQIKERGPQPDKIKFAYAVEEEGFRMQLV